MNQVLQNEVMCRYIIFKKYPLGLVNSNQGKPDFRFSGFKEKEQKK